MRFGRGIDPALPVEVRLFLVPMAAKKELQNALSSELAKLALTFSEARGLMANGALSESETFHVLAAIGRHASLDDRDEARDLLIRVLDRLDVIPVRLLDLVQVLVRSHGLFPYLQDIAELPIQDQLAYETHRPFPSIGENIVFHTEQAIIYERLLAGENVVLSAPTSFGKSLVIDAVLSARDFRNAAIVVPTLALMDETRRRLSKQRERYKIITHGTQSPGARNLYIMTQERMLDMSELPNIDFFVVDEFYKLDPAHSDDRSNRLNLLLRQLIASGGAVLSARAEYHRIDGWRS